MVWNRMGEIPGRASRARAQRGRVVRHTYATSVWTLQRPARGRFHGVPRCLLRSGYRLCDAMAARMPGDILRFDRDASSSCRRRRYPSRWPRQRWRCQTSIGRARGSRRHRWRRLGSSHIMPGPSVSCGSPQPPIAPPGGTRDPGAERGVGAHAASRWLALFRDTWASDARGMASGRLKKHSDTSSVRGPLSVLPSLAGARRKVATQAG